MQQLHAQFFGRSWGLADEYVRAHTHDPGYECDGCLPEERTWHIVCGTFKTDCPYSQRFFGQGRIGVPTAVYHADRHEEVVFPTPFEAWRYMDGEDWRGGEIGDLGGRLAVVAEVDSGGGAAVRGGGGRVL